MSVVSVVSEVSELVSVVSEVSELVSVVSEVSELVSAPSEVQMPDVGLNFDGEVEAIVQNPILEHSLVNKD